MDARDIIEPKVLKRHIVRTAIEACCAVLKIDSVIMEKLQPRYIKPTL